MPLKVLCCVDYFLPGYAGGGPIRTIANMREILAGDVDLAIFTRDRDLGDTTAYAGITVDAWNETEDGRVFYAGPKMFGTPGLARCTKQEQFDLIYLNSFFSPMASIWPYLWARRAHPELPILLAPRGEFSLGALALKRTKKRAYLAIARRFGLYRDVQWHASTADERQDILREFPFAATVHVAEDPVTIGDDQPFPGPTPAGQDAPLRIAFISRVSPMKNLDGLLRVLATQPCRAQLDIFGTIEDRAYWGMCEGFIEKLPPHVSVNYKGALAPEAVTPTFAAYDLFAFPTLGENFGHVVFEALRAGTPVLLSDRTPWRTQATGAITALPLDDLEHWHSALQRAAALSPQEKLEARAAARAYAADYVRNSDALQKNRVMLEEAAREKRGAEKDTTAFAAERNIERGARK